MITVFNHSTKKEGVNNQRDAVLIYVRKEKPLTNQQCFPKTTKQISIKFGTQLSHICLDTLTSSTSKYFSFIVRQNLLIVEGAPLNSAYSALQIVKSVSIIQLLINYL